MDATELFQSYWWLIFPLAFFISAGWDSWMKFQRHKANIELLKSYAASGNEPPADLLRSLESGSKSEMGDISESEWGEGYSGGKSGGGKAFLVLLFAGLGGVFFYAGRTGLLDLGEEAYLVAMIMGVLAVAFLGSAIFGRR